MIYESNLPQAGDLCKYCQSPHLDVVQVSGVHSEKLVCKSCGKLQRWLPNPSTVEASKRVLKTISMLKTKSLAPTEAAFVQSLENWLRFKRPTPRQTAWLESIAAREGVTK
jgi:hypothetical protein